MIINWNAVLMLGLFFITFSTQLYFNLLRESQNSCDMKNFFKGNFVIIISFENDTD